MIYRLYIGNRSTGVAVVPDEEWPGMWRIHAGGRVSDMLNLSRAKDAAILWSGVRRPGGEEVIRWDRRQSAADGSRAAQNRSAA